MKIDWTNLPLSYQNFTPRDNLGKADLAWRKEEGLMPTGTNVVKGGQVGGASTHLNAQIFVAQALATFQYFSFKTFQCYNICRTHALALAGDN